MNRTIRTENRGHWMLEEHPLWSAGEHTINWLRFLPESVGASVQDRSLLRIAARDFLRAWISVKEDRFGLLSPGTVQSRFRSLRALCQWMLRHDIKKFEELTPELLLEYVEGRFGAAAVRTKTTTISVKNFCALVTELWNCRSAYRYPIRFDPRQSPEVANLMSKRATVEGWKPIDLLAANVLLRRALGTVEQMERLNELVATMWRSQGSLIGCKRDRRARLTRRLATVIGEQAALSFSMEGRVPLQGSALSDILQDVVASVLIVILFFSGMRISEALTLPRDCLERRTHSDGQDFWYLRGYAAKKKGISKLWVVPEIIAEIIETFDKLFLNIRGGGKCERLFLGRVWRLEVLTGRVSAKGLPQLSANILMRRFMTRYPELFDVASEFHAHRARKTFARFVVMRDKSGLQALAHHYGHLYAALLDKYYVGTDFSLSELISQEDAKELREGLSDLLSSSSIGGRAGTKLNELLHLQFRGKLGIASLVDKLVNDGVVLAPCDWGYCVYAREESKCRGDAKGPNPVERAPSICASCNNFAVTEKYIVWWNQRAKRLEDFLARDDIPSQTARVVEVQLAAANTILSGLISREVGDDAG